jgi:hypothetical protein
LAPNGNETETTMTKIETGTCSCGQPFSLCNGPFDHERNLKAVAERKELEAERKEPSLAQSLLVGEREIKIAEYRHAISRATQQINDTLAKLADRGIVSTHDGFNLGATASDIQALAAVIESLDRCIASTK